MVDVIAIADKLREQGVRVEVDYGSDRFTKKIRTASTEKVPFILIAGGEDVEHGAVSFRFRGNKQENGVPVDWRGGGTHCRPHSEQGKWRPEAEWGGINIYEYGWELDRSSQPYLYLC